jgi:hypothetical protein
MFLKSIGSEIFRWEYLNPEMGLRTGTSELDAGWNLDANTIFHGFEHTNSSVEKI